MRGGGGGGADLSMKKKKTMTIFTYGTLKRGFWNHGLLQELVRTSEAAFLGEARTRGRLPLVCWPYRVPFLLDLPGSEDRVRRELYSVSAEALARMDELEGTRRGHYERLPIEVVVREEEEEEEEEGEESSVVEAEAYYADKSYVEQLWRRSGEKGDGEYSEREAMGYVKRNDRPQNLTFLDHIRIFVSTAPAPHS